MNLNPEFSGLDWCEAELAELEALAANSPLKSKPLSGEPRTLDVDVAIGFLRRFHPATPWVLVTFGPGANQVGPAQTFQPGEETEARKFIEAQNGRHNIYFVVNAVARPLKKKPSKKDIAEVQWLHVDADLSKALDWSDPVAVTADKARVLGMLRNHSPAPTVVTWSGGGFQAFWRLSEIVVVNGEQDLMAPIERRIRQIESAVRADVCHNVDRVMRLPGTLNLLGPTKVRAGRQPALAVVVEFDESRFYDLEEFSESDEPHDGERNRSSDQGSRQGGAYEVNEHDRAHDALRKIPADNYDTYLRIGMALKSAFGDAGFGLYREWASTSVKFDAVDLSKKWRSIKPEGAVTIATLFDMARRHGWQDRHERDHLTSDEVCGSAGQEKDATGADPDMSIARRNQIAAPVFPLEVLGPSEDWVKTTAESKSAPVDYVALGLIVTAAGMIGPKRRVSPWDGWDEPSILWGALIGPPSVNKSPALDPLRDAVGAIERRANADWSTRQAKFETEKRVAEARRTAWEQEVTAAVKSNKTAPEMPTAAAMPKCLAKDRLWIVDATTEKVARILGENPDGLICFRDELAGLLGGFDRYGGSGSDRAFWIEAYGGRPYRYDRVNLKDEALDIRFCAVSLIGALQPDRLHRMLLSGDDDGLAARILYAWPDPAPPRRPTSVAQQDELLRAMQRLRELAFNEGDDSSMQPRRVLLESEAADDFQAWWEQKQWEAKLAASGPLAGAIGKLDGIALRLALVLELLAWAWDDGNTPEPERVSLQSVRKALLLIDGWVRPNLERVFSEASLPQVQRDALTICRWLLKTRPQMINSRELRRLPGFPGPKEAKELDPAIQMLVDARWLSAPAGQAAPGRPRKNFIVNPAIYKSR